MVVHHVFMHIKVNLLIVITKFTPGMVSGNELRIYVQSESIHVNDQIHSQHHFWD